MAEFRPIAQVRRVFSGVLCIAERFCAGRKSGRV